MSKSENLNVSGRIQIDPEGCMGIRMCAMILPGSKDAVLNTAVYKGKEITYIDRQPVGDDENVLITEAAMVCPFNAFLIEGSSYHPSIKEHVDKTSKDPDLLKRARANLFRKVMKNKVKSNNEK